MGFTQAIRSCFGQYATFSGRASRSEYWWFVLLVTLVALPGFMLGPFVLAILLPFVLPAWGVTARRLHDIDRTAWWIIPALFPLFTLLMQIFWFTRQGTDGANRFGPDPLVEPPVNPTKFTAAPTTSMTEKADQLARIKSLLESGTITQEEFDRMKGDVLAS